MPTIAIALTDSQAGDLDRVCTLGTASLNRIADTLDRSGLAIKRSALRATIAAVTDDQEAAAAILRVLIGLATVVRRSAASAVDLLDGVRQGLVNANWTEPQLKSWHECRPIIKKMLSNASILLSAKALDLSYDFTTIYTASRILTDVRPVFDDERNTIVGAIVTQTLRIEYASDDGDKSVAIALDSRDIEQLKKACEEALRKGVCARELIEDKLHVDTIIPGEGPQ